MRLLNKLIGVVGHDCFKNNIKHSSTLFRFSDLDFIKIMIEWANILGSNFPTFINGSVA